MSYEKIAKILEKLNEKTTQGKIQWEQTNIPDIFQTSFPEYSVRILRQTDEYEYGDYILQLYNSEGILLETANDVDIKTVLEESNQIMRNLYETARRIALKVDESLDSIIAELDKE